MNYVKLDAGTVRKLGDEFARRTLNNGDMIKCHPKGSHVDGITDFKSVNTLLGHPILESDLIHLEFRRPV